MDALLPWQGKRALHEFMQRPFEVRFASGLHRARDGNRDWIDIHFDRTWLGQLKLQKLI